MAQPHSSLMQPLCLLCFAFHQSSRALSALKAATIGRFHPSHPSFLLLSRHLPHFPSLTLWQVVDNSVPHSEPPWGWSRLPLHHLSEQHQVLLRHPPELLHLLFLQPGHVTLRSQLPLCYTLFAWTFSLTFLAKETFQTKFGWVKSMNWALTKYL